MRFAPIALIFLSACMPVSETGSKAPDAMGMASCGADGLQGLIGQPVSAIDTGALGKPARILPPGSVMTMDHRPDRVNIETDDADLITRIWCG